MKILRLQCRCGNNLADVTRPKGNPQWTVDGLAVYRRPNVTMSVFDRRAGVRHDPTYRFDCRRCEATHVCRHARLGGVWRDRVYEASRVVVAIFGHDL